MAISPARQPHPHCRQQAAAKSQAASSQANKQQKAQPPADGEMYPVRLGLSRHHSRCCHLRVMKRSNLNQHMDAFFHQQQ